MYFCFNPPSRSATADEKAWFYFPVLNPGLIPIYQDITGIKVIKKALKILLITVCTAFLFGAGSYFLIRLPRVQTWFTKSIAAYLSVRLNAAVSVRGVDISLFRKVILEGVCFEDQHHDTLLYADRFALDISGFSYKKKILSLRGAELADAGIFLVKYKGDKDLNIRFLLDYFSSPDTSASAPWNISCSRIIFKNISFSYHDMNEPPGRKGSVDYNHLSVYGFNGILDNIHAGSASFSSAMKSFSFTESSGFRVSNLSSSEITITPSAVSFKDLELSTPFSAVKGGISFSYSSWDDFRDFLSLVYIRAKLSGSRLDTRDLSFFSPGLDSVSRTAVFSCDVKGSVSQLKIKNISLQYAGHTSFRGNLSISGLPDLAGTFIDLQADSLTTTREDIEQVPIGNGHLSLPENISSLGTVFLRGKFTGFINDFVAYGYCNTGLGYVSSDINLKYNKAENTTYYSGNFATKNFHIGKFLSLEKYAGRITLDARVEGHGLTKNHLTARLDGRIASVEFNGYNYSNVSVAGNIAKGLFRGSAAVSDENVDLSFNGSIDYSGKIPVFDFSSSVKRAKLQKLHLSLRDTSSELSASMQIHLSGDRPDNLNGTLMLNDISYTEKGAACRVNAVRMNSGSGKGKKNLEILSDLADASFKGNFSFSTLAGAVNELMASYFPSLVSVKGAGTYSDQYFDFNVRVKDTRPFTRIFFPGLEIEPDATFAGTFSASGSGLTLRGRVPGVKYGSLSLKEISLDAEPDGSSLVLFSRCRKLNLSPRTWIDDVDISTRMQHDSLLFRIQLANSDTAGNHADMRGFVCSRDHKFFAGFDASSLISFEKMSWKISPENRIEMDSSSIAVSGFALGSENQALSADGRIRVKPVPGTYSDRMNINFSGFRIETFRQFLSAYGDLRGVLSGSLSVAGSIAGPQLSSFASIPDFSMNGDTLGAVSLLSSWDNEADKIKLSCALRKDTLTLFDMQGAYNLKNEKDKFDFNITLRKIHLEKFSRYLSDYSVRNLRGTAFADLHLSGSPSGPVLTGVVTLQRTGFVYDYLNTTYNFADKIVLSENSIDLNNITLNDAKGNKAMVNGKILHDHFSDFRFDISVAAKEFQCLNTTASMNELYYGTAYATGLITVKGTPDNTMIKMAARSDKGTLIYIPLSNPEEVAQNNFITFISHDTSAAAGTGKSLPELSGIQFEMDVEATPDAEIQLIFDSKIGDVIKGRGNGNIRMEVTALGDFKMYGDYTIEEGDYLFTFMNSINKKFTIERGGTLRWSGDPYAADVSLNALYRRKAALYDMLPGVIDTSYKKPIPYICRLNMNGKIMNPGIRFDVEIPDLRKDETTASLVKKYMSSDQEISKQVFNLLILNRYAPVVGGSASGGGTEAGLGANASEILSNQLSNWASQISSKFDVGVALDKDVMEASLSKQFFNDRVLVDGSVGVINNQQSTNNFVGDINVEVKITNDGKLRLKTYNKSNTGSFIAADSSPYIQGIGLSFKEEFNNFKDFAVRFHERRRRKAVSQ